MKRLLYISLLFLVGVSGMGQNLITNPSFEDSLGNPSLNGWYKWGLDDTLFFKSSTDIPAGGGLWSIRLATAFPQTHHLAWFVTGIQGTFVYQLSVWAKKTVAWYVQSPPVIIAMGIIDSTYYNYPSFLGNNPSFEGIIFDSIPFSWDNVILIDTLTTQPTDTIAVILMGGTTINGPNDYAYYDLAELTITDTLILSTQEIEMSPPPKITVFPNPTSGEFQLTAGNGQEAKVYIYDIFGRLIEQLTINNGQLTIDITQHPKGIYLIKVIQGEEIFIQKLAHQ